MKTTDSQQLHEFIRLIMTAAANAALYDMEHRQVARFSSQALRILQELIGKQGHLIFRLIDGQLIQHNKPLSPTLAVERLITQLSRHGVSYLKIAAGVSVEELLALVRALGSGANVPRDIPDSAHIHLGQVEIRYRQPGLDTEAALQLPEIKEVEADRFMDLYQQVRGAHKIDISGIAEIVNGFVQTFTSQADVFLALAPLRAMDEYTYTHSTNICLLNLAQARALGIEGQLLNDIGIAAMLHDVGKMFISPAILSKTEALSDEEWDIMRQHPRLGAEYLLTVPGIPKLAVITAFEHHLRFDGGGYPQIRNAWKPHYCSYMTAISDTYDAMRTRRTYEEALGLNQIIEIMLNLAGNKLHPQLTYNFLTILHQIDQPDQNYQ